MESLRNRTAFVGVGETGYSKNSGVTTLTLALRSIVAAVQDAGLSIDQIDGLITHRIGDSADPALVAQCLGLRDVRLIRDVYGGGSSASSVIAEAVRAVATGEAQHVVCWRAINARSGYRMGSGAVGASMLGDAQYWLPYRHLSAPQMFAMYARAYMQARGLTAEDLGRVSIAQRSHAALNPNAMMRTPITMDDYLSSRWVVEPLRLLDCCLETDAAVALVVTSRERARDLRHDPVTIAAAVTGPGSLLTSNHYTDLAVAPAAAMAPRLYAAAGVGPGDIDVALLYDAFTPLVLMQLEAYGFCAPGEVAGMVADGRTTLGGSLPVNTHGGHLSAGYAHGLNHVAEAVHQLRRTCGDRQVSGAEIALATSQPGLASGMTGAVVLCRM